jgi:protein-disulfide isomerase
MHDLLFENQGTLRDEDLAEYAAALGLDGARLVREVASSAYAPQVREDFKSGVRAGVNGTPTFFVNGERCDGPRDLKHFLDALTSERDMEQQQFLPRTEPGKIDFDFLKTSLLERLR